MGQILGISDEAAQKRVTRALEHSRQFLARRGVAVGTGALVMALSANAVHAAPAGLAATISTATVATMAGAAIPTSTVIAKTLAMTTLQKTLVGATLLAALGAGIYGVQETANARHQAQAARDQMASLSQTIEQLKRERDDASNQLAGASVEIGQLKQTQTTPEVLRLRGQVGSLRTELASTAAKSNSGSGFSKMMSDPAMREYINQAMTDMIKRRYGPLFTELKLTPEQTEQFVQMVSAEYHKGAQRLATAQQSGGSTPNTPGSADNYSELTEKLRGLLGDSGLARYGQYSQEIPARATVDLLNGQLGASKLTDEQQTRLLQIVKAEPFDLTHGIAGDLDKVFFGPQPDIDSYLAKVGESNQHVLQQAGEFLNNDQLAALNAVFSNGVTARVTQAAAFTPKH
jgi:hypothetical protein